MLAQVRSEPSFSHTARGLDCWGNSHDALSTFLSLPLHAFISHYCMNITSVVLFLWPLSPCLHSAGFSDSRAAEPRSASTLIIIITTLFFLNTSLTEYLRLYVYIEI